MSFHEGSNWQAKKEDAGKPLYDTNSQPPATQGIAEGKESMVQIVHNGENKYWCKCESCGWENSSECVNGGTAIADTGDYSDVTCPVCGSNKLEGDSKYVTEEKYETIVVSIPLSEFLAPYEKVIEKLNRLEADAYWSKHMAEDKPLPAQQIAADAWDACRNYIEYGIAGGYKDKETYLASLPPHAQSYSREFVEGFGNFVKGWVCSSREVWPTPELLTSYIKSLNK